MAAEKKTRYGMTPEDWDATCERARAFIVSCARERRTTTYSELADVLAPARVPAHSYAMVALLNEVCTREDAVGGFVLASLVCTKATGMPGEGYFATAGSLECDGADRCAFWEAECERVYRAFAEGE